MPWKGALEQMEQVSMQPAVIRNSAKTETGLGTQIFGWKRRKSKVSFGRSWSGCLCGQVLGQCECPVWWRTRATHPSVPVPPSMGPQQPEMSLGAFQGTQRAGLITPGLIVFHWVQRGHNPTVRQRHPGRMVRAAELPQGKLSVLSLSKSQELELEKLANKVPLPSLLVGTACSWAWLCRTCAVPLAESLAAHQTSPGFHPQFSSLPHSIVYWSSQLSTPITHPELNPGKSMKWGQMVKQWVGKAQKTRAGSGM